MSDSPAAPVSRGDGIYLALREAIMESALAPETKLPEDTLGKSFGASRTIVRAALARLAAEGLVEVGKTKSARVAHPGRDEAREVFTVRRALERATVALLADGWSPSYAEPIRAHIEAEARASADADHKLSVRLGAEFHILLAELTGNRLLLRHINEIVGRSTLILAVYGAAHPQADSLREHEELLEAMAAGDAARAEGIVDRHIQSVEGRALIPDDTIERSLDEVLAPYSSGSRSTASRRG